MTKGSTRGKGLRNQSAGKNAVSRGKQQGERGRGPGVAPLSRGVIQMRRKKRVFNATVKKKSNGPLTVEEGA